MNSRYSTNEFAIERIETFYQTVAVLEHCEAAASVAPPSASEDPYVDYEDYENLYLVPN